MSCKRSIKNKYAIFRKTRYCTEGHKNYISFPISCVHQVNKNCVCVCCWQAYEVTSTHNILLLSVGNIRYEMKIKCFELDMLFACNILSIYD